MGLLICLFCYLLSATPVSITDYVTGLPFSGREELFGISPMAADTGFLFSMSGSYDLLYREREEHSDMLPGNRTSVDKFSGWVWTGINRDHAGILFGAAFGRLWMRRSEPDDGVSEAALLSNGAVGAVGWLKRGICTMRAGFDGNPRYGPLVSGATSGLKKGFRLLNSPAINLTGSLYFAFPHSGAEFAYRNRSLLSGDGILRNSSNGAYRKCVLLIDEHRWSGTVNRISEGSFWSVTPSIFQLTSNSPKEQPEVFPLEISGVGYSLAGSGNFNRLPKQPGFTVDMERGSLLLNGYDGQARRFLKVDESHWRRFSGAVGLQTGIRSEAGIFGSYRSGRAGKGNVALYPFSNWLFLLDLPDRVRLDEAEIEIREAGIRGVKKWNVHRNLRLRTEVALSGCVVEGSVATANLVRYIGLLPVYEDARKETVDERYAVIRGKLQLEKEVRGHDFHISVQQIVPVRLTGSAPVTAGDQHSGGDLQVRQWRYGGLKVECGIDIGNQGR